MDFYCTIKKRAVNIIDEYYAKIIIDQQSNTSPYMKYSKN
jgi:hypothetical protein